MVNEILFHSTLVFGSVQLYVLLLLFCNNTNSGAILFKTCVLSGILTSLWNHGSTSSTAEYVDRVVMSLICIPVNFYNIYYVVPTKSGIMTILCAFYFGTAMLCYCMAKRTTDKIIVSNIMHMSAHFCITINNLLIMHVYMNL